MNRRMLILAAALTVALPSALFAQSLIFVVRHAERADAGMTSGAGADPDLSEAGRSRAQALATMLKDARITAIYVTEFKRTRQTAEPFAKMLGLEPTVVPSKDASGLIERLKSSSENALVIGHSNTVPEILKSLAGETVTIGDAEFDNLFVLTGGAPRSLLRLHYR